jgi:hypothetical protein
VYFVRYTTDIIAVYWIFSLLGHMQGILEATFIHSRNLALLSLGYKVLTACLRYLESTKREHHSFLAAFVCGYFIFGQFNKITEQVHLETLGFIFRICNYIALIHCLPLFFCITFCQCLDKSVHTVEGHLSPGEGGNGKGLSAHSQD